MKTFFTNDGREMVSFPYSGGQCYQAGNIKSASGLPLSDCCQAPTEYTGGGLAVNDVGHSYSMSWRAQQCVQCGKTTKRQEIKSGNAPLDRTR